MKFGRKVMVLGLDGMEPNIAKKCYMLVECLILKMLERGTAYKDLQLLGAMHTSTPAQWSPLATGAYPGSYGANDFWNQAPDALDTIIYSVDSHLCQAE